MSEEVQKSEEIEEVQPKRGFDKSLLFSLLAIFISLIGTGISVFEASILREQQTTLQEQKAAAVWPYIQPFPWIDYDENENRAIITYSLKNKGIGPAIIGDVTYFLGDDDQLESYLFDEKIRELYPGLQVTTYSNIQIDNIVLSAGEAVDVVRLSFSNVDEIISDDALDQVIQNIGCLFCYCSVYNDCWQVGKDQHSAPVKDCQVAVSF